MQVADDHTSRPLLAVRDLAVSFDNGAGPRIQAVDGVSMTLYPRQTLAVVGESGCGKSVTAMSMMHLLPRPPARIDRGTVTLRTRADEQERELLRMPEGEIRHIRGGEIAMIFQEPMTSLNPVFTIGEQIVEAVMLHQKVGRKQARDIAAQALVEVGISDAHRRLRSYPHQFSGGMRQRVMIAMALACTPRVLLADEPTTALDVTIQAQILELLRELKESRGMGVMLITHDLGVVAENADVVCVMYAGRVVEYARVDVIFDKPLHPYTRGLLASIPKIGESRPRLATIAEIIDRPGAFEQSSAELGGMRAWWPWHEAPIGTDADREYALVEAAPGHWAGVWRTEAVKPIAERAPDLDCSSRSAMPAAL